MKDDPTIEAIRDARYGIAESVGHDPRKLVDLYFQLQKRHQDRLVSRQRPKPETTSEDSA